MALLWVCMSCGEREESLERICLRRICLDVLISSFFVLRSLFWFGVDLVDMFVLLGV